MMLPGFLHLCKLRHGDIGWEVQRYFCRRSGLGGVVVPQERKKRGVLKIRVEKSKARKASE